MAMVFKSVLVWQHFLVSIGEKASVVGLVNSCCEEIMCSIFKIRPSQ